MITSAASEGFLTEAQMRDLERNNLHAALKAANGKLFGKGARPSCSGSSRPPSPRA
ncbi:hypothetical protein [Pseudomonas huanghezhanensis]|uniref:hypothetical protein n=1 Tax=Pseudomonas huanghezhanensis TaxID=3002903 RepID=UPI00228582AB|nr:hypothetical protein [Pseudomonas sp. BSw22131]